MNDHGCGKPSTAAPIMSAFGDVGEGRQQAGRFVARDEGRSRVLVIGRMDAYADLVRQALDALCLHIDLASGEDAARDHLARERCDLIVLLLPLADGDGPALCRRLRAADGHVPLVILDIVGTVDDAVAGLDAGSDAYLVEPFDAGELRASRGVAAPPWPRAPAHAPPHGHRSGPKQQRMDHAGAPGTRRRWRRGVRTVPWPWVARLLRFALTGGAAALVQLGILDALTDGRWPPIPADAVALLLSTQVNFVLSYLYTWRDRRPRAGTPHGVLRRWAAYQGSAGGAALLNIGVFTLARTDLPIVVASALGTIVASVVNFVASDRLVFPAVGAAIAARGSHSARETAAARGAVDRVDNFT